MVEMEGREGIYSFCGRYTQVFLEKSGGLSGVGN